MESIPGVSIVAGVVEGALGVDAFLARVIAAAVILVGTAVLLSVLTMVVLDESKPTRSSTGGGSASGSVTRGSDSGTPSVVLMGPSLGGKTALFHRLCTNNLPRTVTSLEAASASAMVSYREKDATLTVDARVVDMPGHVRAVGRERLPEMLRAPSTKLVLLVVDASNKASVREGANLLADLLTSASFVDSGARVAIVGTRADVVRSSDAGELLAAIEAEIDNIRRSEATLATEGAVSRESDRIALGAMTGEPFSLKRDSALTDPVQCVMISNTAETGPFAGQRPVRKIVVETLS